MKAVNDSFNVTSFGFVRQLARTKVKNNSVIDPPIRLNNIIKSINPKIAVKGEDLGEADGYSINLNLICYNSKHSEEKIRFTIAHEVGHILLGHNSGNRIINFYSKDPNEQLANAFAAELLVPLGLLKKESLFLTSLSELAKKYWVSKDMMMWRLKDTKLDIKLSDWH